MSIDIDQCFYNDGTATIETGGLVVSGLGTIWQGAVRAGDMFGTHCGSGVRIRSVDSNTQLTLAYPWPLAAQTNAPYEIQFTPYDAGYQPAVRKLLSRLTNGNLDAFSSLAGSADMVPIFIGAGAMALVRTDMLGGGAGGGWNATVMLLSGRDAYNDRPTGFRVMVVGDGTERSAVYEKTGEGAGDWSAPIYFTGAVGADGRASTFKVGDVKTGAAGSPVIIENVGTEVDAVLNITIPMGETGLTGAPNTLEIGTVVAGEEAAANITGEGPHQMLHLVLPRGLRGFEGKAATVKINSVTTGLPGTEAQVTNFGTDTDALLDIVIPAGHDGLGTGDMKSSDYDPDGKGVNVYDMDNMQESDQSKVLSSLERQNIAEAERDRHTHSNKSVLDDTTESFTTPLKSKLENLPANANQTNTATVGAALSAASGEQSISEADSVAGVQSGTSNVRRWTWGIVKAWIKGWISKADVGLGNVANLAPTDMPVSVAQQAVIDGKLNKEAQAVDSAKFGGKLPADFVGSSRIIISSASPSGGVNGDLWFKL